MKRNFLLMLLLTLLPVVGWAQDLGFKEGTNPTANDPDLSEVTIPYGQQAVRVTVWYTGTSKFWVRTGILQGYDHPANSELSTQSIDYTVEYRETTNERWATATDAFPSGSSFQVTNAGYYRVVASYNNARNQEQEKTSVNLKVNIEGSEATPAPRYFDLSVTPVNGQSKVYGAKFELTPAMITTNSTEVNANEVNAAGGETKIKTAVFNKLQLESDLKDAPVGQTYYSFGLAGTPSTETEVGDDVVETEKYKEGDLWFKNVYTIKPSGTGTITISKATDNDWTTDPVAVLSNPTYNGADQALITTAAVPKYGEAVYYVISGFTGEGTPQVNNIPAEAEWVELADVVAKNAGDYYVFAKVVDTDDYSAIAPTALGKATIGKVDQASVDGYQPTSNGWEFDGDKHNLVNAPVAAENADLVATYKYYAVNKADLKDGYHFPDGSEEGDDAKWSTTIPQGKNVADNDIYVYWYVEGNNNINGIARNPNNHLNSRITPAQVEVVLEKDVEQIINELIPATYLYKGGYDITVAKDGCSGVTLKSVTGDIDPDPTKLGVSIEFVIEKEEAINGATVWALQSRDRKPTNKITGLGNYRINARLVGNDNVLGKENGNYKEAYLADGGQKPFSVVTPTVYITVYADPKIVGVGSLPTPKYEVKWEEGDKLDNEKLTANPQYTYWKNGSQITDLSNGLGLGTYEIQATGFSTNYHNVVYKYTTFIVAPSQIEAEIASYTGDDALIYGQTLPLKLKYVSGYGETDTEAIEEFENATWGNRELVATNEAGEKYYLERYPKTVYTGFFPRTVYLTTALPVGTYTVSANFKNGNQQFITKTGTWEVKPMDINDTDQEFYVNNIGDNFSLTKTYKGVQIVPDKDDLLTIGSWNDKGISFRYQPLVYGDEYEIEGPTDPKANINVADGGTFTIKGVGNFTGEKTLNFTIAPLDIYVSPLKAEWAIGSDPKYTDKIDWDAVTDQLVGQDIDKWTDFKVQEAQGFKDLKVRRLAPVTVGVYPAGVEAYLDGTEQAENYNIICQTAELKITKGKIFLQFVDVDAAYNGKDAPKYEYEFKPIMEGENKSDLSEVLLDNDNWKTLIPAWENGKWNVVKNLQKIAADARYTAGNSYVLTYNADENPKMYEAMNYEVKVVNPTAKLNVKKSDITLFPKTQNVASSKYVNTVVDASTIDIALGSEGFKNGDAVKYNQLIKSINVDEENMKLTLTEKSPKSGWYTNYNVILEDGKWEYKVYPDLVLTSEESDWNEITKAQQDGISVTVPSKAVEKVTLTLKESEMKTNAGDFVKFPWAANEWHAMVLPFDAKVSEISAYFGYAIVNVVNKDGASVGDVVFRMPEITEFIPANTPFCVKSAKDVYTGAKDSYTATFKLDREEGEDQYFVVVNPETKQVSVDADNGEFGYKFCGTYEEKMLTKANSTLRFLGPNSKWSKIGVASNAKFDMMPYTGYVDLTGENAGTREVNFIFEEEDGSTTAIKAVDFMNPVKSTDDLYNVNGMKVQNANQKGIYIQNGKKFVVK